MTERTTVTESVAKKLCLAGEESGVGFVDSRKKTRVNTSKNTWLCRHFSLVEQGGIRKTREIRNWNKQTKIYFDGLGWNGFNSEKMKYYVGNFNFL